MSRWIGYDFTDGIDSDTEFFGLNDVELSRVREPASIALLGLDLGLAATLLRRSRG